MKARERLFELLGADRWVEGAFPAVEPASADEVSRLLKGYPGPVVVVGSGTNFSQDFNPGEETLVLLTRRLRSKLDLSVSDQVLSVSCGCPILEVNQLLNQERFTVPAISRFKEGTVGGRFCSLSAKPVIDRDDSWGQNLLGLNVVLPTGEILKLGGKCIKDVAGYDLKCIFAGSRGSAGVVIDLFFRCYPTRFYRNQRTNRSVGNAGRFDTQWKRLLDPIGRMRSGA